MKIKSFLIVFVLALAALGFKCGGGGSKDNPDDGVFRGQVYTDHAATTAKGAKLYSRNPVDAILLPLADEGLDTLFRIASAAPNNYTTGLAHSLYTIYLFPRSPRCESPAFVLDASGSPYDQTEWDKDTRPGKVLLCAAGMMAGGSQYSMIVAGDASIMREIVWFEAEHLILFNNDYPRFQETMYHTGGNGHPILRDSEGEFSKKTTDNGYQEYSYKLSENLEISDNQILAKGTRICALLTK